MNLFAQAEGGNANEVSDRADSVVIDRKYGIRTLIGILIQNYDSNYTGTPIQNEYKITDLIQNEVTIYE